MVGRALKLIPFIFILFNLGDAKRNNHTYSYQGYNSEGRLTVNDDMKYLDYRIFTATDVKFYMYTPPPDNKPILITSANKHLLNMKKPTKIIVHGLGGYKNQFWINEMVSNYHTKGDYNIIAVDWSKHSTNDQFFAVAALNEVGEVIAEFIVQITEENLELLKDIHLIGSNEGAHIGGVFGRKIKEKTNATVDRITGLDPTEFDKNEKVPVLDKDDAEFVDVVHTQVVGQESNFGTVDFYVTGDKPNRLVCNGSCVHVSAPELFVWTIVDDKRYTAVPCENETAYIMKLCQNRTGIPMGEYVPRNVSGTFFLSTDSAFGLQGSRLMLVTLVLFSLLDYY